MKRLIIVRVTSDSGGRKGPSEVLGFVAGDGMSPARYGKAVATTTA
jgi:hypothetical protein